jgi:[ribosomal protein S5]-alanine N-acetyltransferase
LKQAIVGWHQDEKGDWVAELACGHGQHVRHFPPLSFRPWVLTPEGRASFIGYELDCVRCDEERAAGSPGERGPLDELTTERLIIRPFVEEDLPEIHRILNAAFKTGTPTHVEAGLAERRSWLRWSVLSAHWLPAMHQPPYGDRAVVLKETGQLIGAVGFVPALMPFDQIPELARVPGPREPGRMTPEVGLFWAIDPGHQRKGYATEAGAALLEYAFEEMRLWRTIATTEYHNRASQAVMRKLGMTLTRNPHAESEWMQVVGVIYSEPMLPPEGLLT